MGTTQESDRMSIVDLKGIGRIYGEGDTEVRALDEVDLLIESGEIVALLGPSGSGKTTLLNIIAALDTPTTGTYSFTGDEVELSDVGKMTDFRRENIGYIFQFFNLLGDLTALENIMLVQDLCAKRDRAYAVELLERVGLKGLEDRFPSQMSGGQRQRVAIARALSSRPNMMLGDELTGNLDSETSIKLMETLIEICRKEGMTVLFVTHDRSLTKYSTRVLQLESGRIINDSAGGLSTISGQVEFAAKDVMKGAKKIATRVLEFADDIIG